MMVWHIAMRVNHIRYALAMYFRMLDNPVVEHWTTKHKIAGSNPRMAPTQCHVLVVLHKMVAVHIW